MPALIAPVLAGLVALGATVIVYRLIRNFAAERAERGFRWAQVASSSMVALAHGTNDAQKTMGVIWLALIANGNLSGGDNFDVPDWVVFSCGAAIALGTYTRRLADHQDARHEGHRGAPAAGLLLRGGRRDGDPRVLALRLPALDHPRGLGRRHRLRRRPPGRAGRLERRRADRHRLGADAARRGPDRRGRVLDHRHASATARSGRSPSP